MFCIHRTRKPLKKGFLLGVTPRDRFIYLIIILICGFGLLECLFFAFFPPRLVAQTLPFPSEMFFSCWVVVTICRHISNEKEYIRDVHTC